MNDIPVEQWMRLRAGGIRDGDSDVHTIATQINTGFGPVRFAIGSSGEPRLLVPCGPDPGSVAQLSTGKLVVNAVRLTLDGRASMYVDVISVERSLDSVFAEVAVEVLRRIREGIAPIIAVGGTIHEFKELLGDGADADAPDSKIIGLVGELLILKMLCAKSPLAIEAWTGPLDQRHDFRRAGLALEVKTSSRADAATVGITSIEQLTAPSGGSLVLVHVRIERAQSGSLSVSSLVRALEEAGVDRVEIALRLASVGCGSSDAAEWNRVQYELEGIAGYRVLEGFPRINSTLFTDGKLPDGIRSISYVVDLQLAQRFRLDDAALDDAFGELAP